MSSLAYTAPIEFTPLNLIEQIQHWTPAVLLSLCLNLLALQLFTDWNAPREIRITENMLQIQLRAVAPVAKKSPIAEPKVTPKLPPKQAPAPKPKIVKPVHKPPEQKLSVPPIPRPTVESTPPQTQVQEPLPPSNPAPTIKRKMPKPVALHKLSRMPGFALKVSPSYPEDEHDSGKEASVLVELLISHIGEIHEIKIIKSGGTAFDEAVLTALRQSRFIPGYVKHEAVAVRIQIPFRFQLD